MLVNGAAIAISAPARSPMVAQGQRTKPRICLDFSNQTLTISNLAGAGLRLLAAGGQDRLKTHFAELEAEPKRRAGAFALAS